MILSLHMAPTHPAKRAYSDRTYPGRPQHAKSVRPVGVRECREYFGHIAAKWRDGGPTAGTSRRTSRARVP